MKTFKRTVTALSALALTSPAWAATRTATLDVPGMTCSTCPITVKKALTKVSGVSKIDFSLGKKQAVVTYDDAKTNVEALINATTDPGFPSTPATTGKE